MFNAVVAEWQASIGKYSYERLERAIDRCKQEHSKTVTLPEFMQCLFLRPHETTSFAPLRGITYQESDEKKAARIKRGESAVKNMLKGLGASTPPRKPIEKLDYDEAEILAELESNKKI